MNEVEAEFLTSQYLQSFVWLRYTDDIFLYMDSGRRKTRRFLTKLDNFQSNLSFISETSKSNIYFSDLHVSLKNGAVHTELYIKPTDSHQYLLYQSSCLQQINVIPYIYVCTYLNVYTRQSSIKG